MITFDLIRHGESKWMQQAASLSVPVFGGRMPRVDLSSTGEQQARTFGVHARRIGICPNAVYASPYRRTVRTAQLSREAGGWNAPFDTDVRLQELNWGNWEKQPRSLANHPQWKKSRLRLGASFQPPGGESFSMVRQRVLHVLRDIARDLPDGSYVWIITHQNVIKSIVSSYRGWDPDKLLSVSVAPLSRTLLAFVPGGRSKLLFFNRGMASPR